MISIKRISPLPSYAGVNQGITQGFTKGGSMIVTDLVRSLTTGARSGRVYIIRGKRHTASAAGEAPAKITGALAKSVRKDVSNKSLTVGETSAYAGYLENGTQYMGARPHLKPAVERNAEAVARLIGDNVVSRSFK